MKAEWWNMVVDGDGLWSRGVDSRFVSRKDRVMRIALTTTLAAFLLMPAALVHAIPMAYEFTGVVDTVNDPSGLLDGSVQPGTAFSGRFTFDSSAEDSISSPLLGEYTGPSFSMTLTVGSYSWFSGPGNGDVDIQNDAHGDGFSLGTEPFPVDVNIQVFMGCRLYERTGDVFLSDALPVDPFPLSSFQGGFGVKGYDVLVPSLFDFGGQLSSFTIVPEPTVVLLIALALGILQRRSVNRSR